jgi:hypothetical protein
MRPPPDKAIRQVFAAIDRILKAGMIAINTVMDGESE